MNTAFFQSGKNQLHDLFQCRILKDTRNQTKQDDFENTAASEASLDLTYFTESP